MGWMFYYLLVESELALKLRNQFPLIFAQQLDNIFQKQDCKTSKLKRKVEKLNWTNFKTEELIIVIRLTSQF